MNSGEQANYLPASSSFCEARSREARDFDPDLKAVLTEEAVRQHHYYDTSAARRTA